MVVAADAARAGAEKNLSLLAGRGRGGCAHGALGNTVAGVGESVIDGADVLKAAKINKQAAAVRAKANFAADASGRSSSYCSGARAGPASFKPSFGGLSR